jgi:hypothetical protein
MRPVPFINQDLGRIESSRLVFAWIAVVLACALGVCCALAGQDFLFAIWLCTFLAACFTVRGLTFPIGKAQLKQRSSDEAMRKENGP